MSSQFTFSLDPVLVPHIRTQHREILTSIPCDGTRDIVERLEKVESRSMHGQIPLVWDKALDYNIFDQAGRIIETGRFQTSFTIRYAALPSGMYFLECTNGLGTAMDKIFIP